jgi:hypothetical protein
MYTKAPLYVCRILVPIVSHSLVPGGGGAPRTPPPPRAAYVACMAWRAGTTTLCRSQLYFSVRDYEFAYWVLSGSLCLESTSHKELFSVSLH